MIKNQKNNRLKIIKAIIFKKLFGRAEPPETVQDSIPYALGDKIADESPRSRPALRVDPSGLGDFPPTSRIAVQLCPACVYLPCVSLKTLNGVFSVYMVLYYIKKIFRAFE